jgi:rhodanese-related sulfurtransferase
VESATRELAAKAQVRASSLPDFQKLRASGDPYYAVDIRLPAEYRAGHLPGAIPIPTGQFALQHENFLAVRHAPVVIIADDEIRPVWAAAQCQELGFSDVRVLEGGISAWTAAGHDLETGDMPTDTFGLDDARRQVYSVDARTLDAERARDQLLLDVRGSGEFGMGHIPGARWLARGKLELGIAALAPDRSIPIVAVCDSGVRSALAAATLHDLGYTNVRCLDGGIAAWRSAGLPIDDGLEGADVTRAEAQGDFGSTLWSGAMARTREDMLKYLADEEALGHRATPRRGVTS